MRELYVNGAYVRYVTTADLKVLLGEEIHRARRHRGEYRLKELERKQLKMRQLHEPPSESRFAQ